MMNEMTANTDSTERLLLYDLWKVLKGEEKEEIALNDIKLLIMAILRIRSDKRIGLERKESDDSEDIGFYNS